MIEIIVNGKKMKLEEARKLYNELHEIFGENQKATPYIPPLPYAPFQPSSPNPFNPPEPLKIWSSGSISGDPDKPPLDVRFKVDSNIQ